jgi:hypothetical protein
MYAIAGQHRFKAVCWTILHYSLQATGHFKEHETITYYERTLHVPHTGRVKCTICLTQMVR